MSASDSFLHGDIGIGVVKLGTSYGFGSAYRLISNVDELGSLGRFATSSTTFFTQEFTNTAIIAAEN